jgi:hypothetical protein
MPSSHKLLDEDAHEITPRRPLWCALALSPALTLASALTLALGLALAPTLVLAGAGCSPAGAQGTGTSGTTASPPGAASAQAGAKASPTPSAGSTGVTGGTTPGAVAPGTSGDSTGDSKANGEGGQKASDASDASNTPPSIKADEAEAAQFVTAESKAAPEVVACRGLKASADADKARIRCTLAHLLRADPIAVKAATDLFEKTGNVVGVEVDHWMDGGYRGKLHLVPEPPVGQHRKHLEWVAQASYDFDSFFAGLTAAATRPVRYRHRALLLRYLRSVGARTPSAFAYDWTVSYNVSGSLHRTPDAVRETMFHEIFHLNDKAHGGWSLSALGAIYAGIAARCGMAIPCLTPYAPSETVIRGGTYYAFHPENGVQEYAAELSLRYYREQRAMLLKRPLPKPPFKCGPPENVRSWELLRDEFFGGVDLVPACRAR